MSRGRIPVPESTGKTCYGFPILCTLYIVFYGLDVLADVRQRNRYVCTQTEKYTGCDA